MTVKAWRGLLEVTQPNEPSGDQVLIEHLASAVAELHLPAAFLEPVSPLTSWMSAIWMCESYQLWRCQMLSRL